MFPLKFLPAVTAAVLLAAVLPSPAQQVNTEFRIQKIEPTFVESPNFSGPQYNKRGTQKAGSWLEVEVTFEWNSKKDPKFADELTANFYILLSNKGQQFPQGALLVGSVNMVSVPQGKDLHTVAFLSPRTLERMFDPAKVPPTVPGAVTDIGVTLSKQGQVVASTSWKSTTGEWWPKYQQTPGYVLNKNETPFAPLAWDYYEAIKPKGGGL